MQTTQITSFIKQKAASLGFDYCGFAKADFLEEEAPRLEKWLKEGKHGSMKYMENYFDKRLDPRKLMEGAKSVVSLLLNYYPDKRQVEDSEFKISKYAFGKDYHLVIKDKLKLLLDEIRIVVGDIHGRAFVDSAPVMDKAWAKKSGNGWVGKNSNLINKNSGSFFFLAELILDIELEYDGPIKDFCGTCTKCIDACPTDAIVDPYVIDANKCISYLTIELKDQISDQYKGRMDNWVFGCDVCQDVCPWNRFSQPHKVIEFDPSHSLLSMSKNDWLEISDEVFKTIFKDSAVKRTKLNGLKRNIRFLDQS